MGVLLWLASSQLITKLNNKMYLSIPKNILLKWSLTNDFLTHHLTNLTFLDSFCLVCMCGVRYMVQRVPYWTTPIIWPKKLLPSKLFYEKCVTHSSLYPALVRSRIKIRDSMSERDMQNLEPLPVDYCIQFWT